jgi:hypothetical protein
MSSGRFVGNAGSYLRPPLAAVTRTCSRLTGHVPLTDPLVGLPRLPGTLLGSAMGYMLRGEENHE